MKTRNALTQDFRKRAKKTVAGLAVFGTLGTAAPLPADAAGARLHRGSDTGASSSSTVTAKNASQQIDPRGLWQGQVADAIYKVSDCRPGAQDLCVSLHYVAPDEPYRPYLYPPGADPATHDVCDFPVASHVRPVGKNKWDHGKITVPSNGRSFTGKMQAVDENTVKARGYWGIDIIGMTDTWTRLDPTSPKTPKCQGPG